MLSLSAAPQREEPYLSAYQSPLLDLPGAVAGSGPDQGVPWHFGDPFDEQRVWAREPAFVDLSHLAVISVAGPDRLTWLHNIFSQDFSNLRTGQSIETLVLDANGRIENGAFAIDDGTQTWLITEAEYAQPLVDWLERMRFMMQVEVARRDEEFALLGFNRTEADPANDVETDAVFNWVDPWPIVVAGGTSYGPPTPEHPGHGRQFRLSLFPREGLADRAGLLRTYYDQVGIWAVEAQRIEHARPRLARDVDYKMIPHELDWLRTAVHLHKGCYRGQETVARVHNLGRPPRRVVLLHLDGSENALVRTGDAIALVDKPERGIGTVLSTTQHWELGPVALAVVKRSTPPDAGLIVTGADATQVLANQEVIVSPEGVTADRPAARGPLTRGLSPRTA